MALISVNVEVALPVSRNRGKITSTGWNSGQDCKYIG